jgi:hypothetical protein
MTSKSSIMLSSDITYTSLARAFSNGKLAHHKETLRRMAEMSRHRSWTKEQTKEQREARERMALFPAGEGENGEEGGVEVLFVKGDIWVVSAPLNLSQQNEPDRL